MNFCNLLILVRPLNHWRQYERTGKNQPAPRRYLFLRHLRGRSVLPGAGLDAITLLEREGIRVHFPEEQTCCGQPAYTSGFPDEARKVATLQLTLFPNDWPVVVPPAPAPA
jgi:L-lactate dehydrogenase complex protein LldE